MADEEDVRLVRDGRRDLQRCDLRREKFVGLDLRERDFSEALLNDAVFDRCNLNGSIFTRSELTNTKFVHCNVNDCQFNGALVGTNFTSSDLRGSRMQGVYVECDFSNSKLEGVDFSDAQINEGNKFQSVTFNSSTNFENTKGMRVLSRLPLFQHFRFERGAFTRTRDNEEIQVDLAPETSGSDIANTMLIARHIARNVTNTRLMATTLAIAIDDQLAELSIPNDAAALDRYKRFVDILTQVRDSLTEISRSLDISNAEPPHFEATAGIVASLRERVGAWLKSNSEVVTSYGIKTGLLGAGCAFLTFCGAPAWQAFPALAFMLEGKQLADSFRYTGKPDSD